VLAPNGGRALAARSRIPQGVLAAGQQPLQGSFAPWACGHSAPPAVRAGTNAFVTTAPAATKGSFRHGHAVSTTAPNAIKAKPIAKNGPMHHRPCPTGDFTADQQPAWPGSPMKQTASRRPATLLLLPPPRSSKIAPRARASARDPATAAGELPSTRHWVHPGRPNPRRGLSQAGVSLVRRQTRRSTDDGQRCGRFHCWCLPVEVAIGKGFQTPPPST